MNHVLVWNFGIRKSLEEAFVFINSDFTFLTVPDCTKWVQCLAVQLDWVRNKLREFFYNLFHYCLLAEFSALRGKLDDDASSTVEVEVICVRNFEGSHAVGYPSHSLCGSGLAREHFDVMWHYKTWVKADTELSDDRVRNALINLAFLEIFYECSRARLCNRAQIVDIFITIHTDAWIKESNCTFFWVGRETDIQFISSRLYWLFATLNHESSFFKSIWGVGEQFSNKDLFISIYGLRNDVEQFSRFSLEFTLFSTR